MHRCSYDIRPDVRTRIVGPMKIQLPEKVLALVIVPLALSLMLFAVLAFSLQQAEMEAEREAHSKELRGRCAIVYNWADNTVKALINYALSKDKQFLVSADESFKELQPKLDTLMELVDRNAKDIDKHQKQERSMNSIQLLARRTEAYLQIAAQRPDKLNVPDLWRTAQQLKIELQKLTLYESRGSARDEDRAKERRDWLKQFLMVAAGLNIGVAAWLVIFFVRPIVHRLTVLKINNQRLAAEMPLLPLIPGTDEIAEIDKGFHDMAVQLAESFRKEQAMSENANDIICSLDAAKTFLKVNSACLNTLGYTPAEIRGLNLSELVSSESSTTAVDEVIQSKGSGAFELEMKKKDGKTAMLLWTAHWAEFDKALFCVLHDITERKRLERMKQEFVSMVSHDLRSPLTSILATLALIRQGAYGSLSPTGENRVKRSERNVYSLIGLINEILDIDKIESGQFQLDRRETELGPLIERALELVSELATQKKVTIETENLGLTVFIDFQRFLQVIVNLVSNAIKYSPEGGVIRIVAKLDDSAFELRISDQGRGIPETMRTAIFDRFKQVELADSTKRGGSGLGLSICKSMVEAHGGTIAVDSVEGEGSTFWMRIPNASALETTKESVGEKIPKS